MPTPLITDSQVFPAWRAMYQDLTAATWPQHPKSKRKPPVTFADRSEITEEGIACPGSPPRPTATAEEWAVMGPAGQDERFTLMGVIWCCTPGQKEDEAFNRLEQLVQVVQRTFRDPVRGTPAGAYLLALGPMPVWSWIARAFLPEIYALDTEGYGARCTFELAVAARI